MPSLTACSAGGERTMLSELPPSHASVIQSEVVVDGIGGAPSDASQWGDGRGQTRSPSDVVLSRSVHPNFISSSLDPPTNHARPTPGEKCVKNGRSLGFGGACRGKNEEMGRNSPCWQSGSPARGSYGGTSTVSPSTWGPSQSLRSYAHQVSQENPGLSCSVSQDQAGPKSATLSPRNSGSMCARAR